MRTSWAPTLLDGHATADLSAGEEAELARAAQAGDAGALQRLCTSHMRLVWKLSYGFRHFGMPGDDLVAEGMLGLVEASSRFDPDRGVRFHTYATYWIKTYLQRITTNHRRNVRPPQGRNGRRLVWHMRSTEQKLLAALGRPPTREEVAAELGVTLADVEAVDGALSGRDVQIDAPNGPRIAVATESPEALATESEARELVRRGLFNALPALRPKELHVLRERYFGEDEKTLHAIGVKMEPVLCRERVRQIEAEALRKVRLAIQLDAPLQGGAP